MDSLTFSKKDLRQMKALGITERGTVSQLDAFKRPAPYLRLKRPCTVGDGIHTLAEEELPSLIERHKAAADQGRCLKFVPASGAATRMFEAPLWLYTHEPRMDRNEIARRAEAGKGSFKNLLAFVDNFERFAFFDALKRVMAG
nr:DUF4301 family protein [Deltaproteobacteria bacterium]